MRDEHVKDAAQDVAENVTQDVAEDVSGTAEDGNVKLFIVARATTNTFTYRPPRFPWATREGRARQRCGAGRCGGRAEGVPQDVAKIPAFGARAPRAFLASPLATTAAAAVFAQLTLR